MDAFIGTILAVGFSFPPRGWMTCAGQLLSVNQNAALYALLGTQYGGDGVNTFALPDLRGRVPVGFNAGPGIPSGRIDGPVGMVGGTTNSTVIANGNGIASVTLTQANLPAHTHAATFTPAGASSLAVEINVSTIDATSAMPSANDYLAAGATDGNNPPYLYAGSGPTVKLNAATATVTGNSSGGTVTIGSTGSGATLNAPVTVSATANVGTVPPFLSIQYIIAINGIYPSRN